jgi:hypothetical protein
MAPVRSRACSAALVAASTVATRASAVDRFEIQVYDGTANSPGVASLENHVNFTDQGHREPAGPEPPTHHQAHWTFEGAVGMTPVWEAGFYLQTALVPGEGFEYAGTKLRSKFVMPRTFSRRFRLAANFELARIPESFEHDQWSTEIRPIATLELDYLRLSINPILDLPLAHGAYRDGPEFEPAVSLKGKLSNRAALGLEYYAGVGPVGALAPAKDQEHYLYGAGDYDLGAGFDLNLGVGYGFGEASERLTLKAIVAYEFGRIW